MPSTIYFVGMKYNIGFLKKIKQNRTKNTTAGRIVVLTSNSGHQFGDLGK